jgi:hypothetical protein
VPLAVTGDLTGMTLPKIIAANNAVLSKSIACRRRT